MDRIERKTCSVRCLDPAMVATARSGLRNNEVATVGYVCTISGAQERLVLISDPVGEELGDLSDALSDRVDAVLFASVLSTELCICDLATLAGRPEAELHARLERLVGRRLLSHRLIDGMNYFRTADGPEAEKLRAHLIKRMT